MDFLKKVDIFAQGISLTINKKETAQTIFGGLLSIVLISLIGSMFFLNMQDVFYHTNPSVNFQEMVMTQSPNVTLDKNSMPIAIELSGVGNAAMYLPNYFTYNAILTRGATNDTVVNYPQILKICEKGDFPNLDNTTFYSLAINTMSCLTNQNISIGGSWTESYVSYLSLSINMCVNNTLTNNNTCANPDDIINYLDTNLLYWNLYFLNTHIDAREQVVQLYSMKVLYKLLKSDNSKIVEIKIKNQALYSDDGVIFATNNTISSLTYDNQDFDYKSLNKAKSLMVFRIYASNKVLSYYRTYTKIQQVLASIGGLANVVRVVFITLCYLFSIIQRDEEILNKIFDYNVKSVINVGNKNISENISNSNKKAYFFQKSENKATLSNKDVSSVQINPTPSDYPKYKFVRQNNNNNSSVVSPSTPKNNNSNLSGPSTSRTNVLVDQDSINSKNQDSAKNIMKLLETRKGEYRLDFSFCEIILAFCFCRCCQSKTLQNKRELYKNSKFVIEEFLDINYIIQKLGEVEKLKMILFNYNQLALFDFISKESVFLKSENREKNIIGKYRALTNDKQLLAKLILDFKTKINDPNNDLKNIDKKMYEMLNEDFKN